MSSFEPIRFWPLARSGKSLVVAVAGFAESSTMRWVEAVFGGRENMSCEFCWKDGELGCM